MKPFNTNPGLSVEAHKEALDLALRQALGTSQPALRAQALDRVARHLIHPRLILESPLLADFHPWKQEAMVVSDAFESVTNGMEEPGLLEALDKLESHSFFSPWRHLILAIHFFYENLDEAVANHLSKIPEDSPLQTLAAALGAMAGFARIGTLMPTQRQLIAEAARPDKKLLQWIQDVAEGLETDQEELFWGALTDWLEAMAPASPEQAKSALLWAWKQLEWRNFDEAVTLDLGTSLWGQAESYRLAALGTIGWDPEGAALLWLRFLISSVRENTLGGPELREGCRLLERFRKAASEPGAPPAEWSETWNSLARTWNSEITCLGLAYLQVTTECADAGITVVSRLSNDGQLDLFS